jgi:hypothetical protein
MIFFWTGVLTMTLQELYEQLLPSFPDSVQKDVKTAIRVLANALQCPDPQHCPLEQFHRPLPSLYHLLETFLLAQGKSIHTIRNIKNHVSRLFRLAEENHLFSLVPLSPTRRYARDTKPFRPGSLLEVHHGIYLPYAYWPAMLQEDFLAFSTWATAPVVPGRSASLRKRDTTIVSYRHSLERYFGFLVHHRQLSTLRFDQLFDFDLVQAFVLWHVNEFRHRTTASIEHFLVNLLALTRQYHPDPELRGKILTLKKTLPRSTPVYDKDDAWVPLAKLNEIGHTLWPKTSPQRMRHHNAVHHGLRTAVYASISLMLRLWTYIPYRQRNIREMQLCENLRKDAHDKWRITFRGEQLKIATKRGHINLFDLPFPETLVPCLEDYLHTWRPILLAKATQPYQHVFLTSHGNPYQTATLHATTSNIVYSYTGKHWHPHNVRSVWATEWIRKTHGDFYTAAIMLNDRLETVIAKYAHLLEEDVAEKAYRLIDERNNQGK